MPACPCRHDAEHGTCTEDSVYASKTSKHGFSISQHTALPKTVQNNYVRGMYLPAPTGTPADVPDWGIPAHCHAWWTGMSPQPTYKMPSVVEVTKGTRVQGTPESLPVLKSPGLLVPPARITHHLLELLATASIFFCPTLPSLQTTSASALASPQYLERSYLSALPAKVEACLDPPSPENAHQYSTKGKSRV